MGLFSGSQPKPGQPTLTWQPLESQSERIGGIYPSIARTKVPGGWLVIQDSTDGSSICFLPNAQHAWDGNSLA